MNRAILFTTAAVFAAAMIASPKAHAAPARDAASLTSQYSSWAGGKSNADSLVRGLRNGSSVMLTTSGRDRTSLAGFTPPARLSDEEIAEALSSARAALAAVGISRPTAEQIQAALIGGEVTLANGSTRVLRGSLDGASGGIDVVATR